MLGGDFMGRITAPTLQAVRGKDGRVGWYPVYDPDRAKQTHDELGLRDNGHILRVIPAHIGGEYCTWLLTPRADLIECWDPLGGRHFWPAQVMAQYLQDERIHGAGHQAGSVTVRFPEAQSSVSTALLAEAGSPNTLAQALAAHTVMALSRLPGRIGQGAPGGLEETEEPAMDTLPESTPTALIADTSDEDDGASTETGIAPAPTGDPPAGGMCAARTAGPI